MIIVSYNVSGFEKRETKQEAHDKILKENKRKKVIFIIYNKKKKTY